MAVYACTPHTCAWVRPDKLPAFIKELVAVAKRDGVTGYRLAKDADIQLATAQRFLASDLNPTASTVESIAKALGMVVKVERK